MSQTEKKREESALMTKLLDAEERYRKKLEEAQGGSALNQEKLEYTLPSDEEITASAEREGKRYYEEKAGKTNDKYDALGEELKAKAESRRELAEEGAARLEDAYRERRESAEDEALARGLGRSSIIMGQIEAFDREKIADQKTLYEDYAEELSEITSKLNSLDAKRNAELNALEYESAEKTEESIRELKAEREKKLAEMIKYNNTISEKEQKYADANGGISGAEAKKLKQAYDEEKYMVAKSVLDSKTPSEAFGILISDKRYQELLGEYFPYLLNYYRKNI